MKLIGVLFKGAWEKYFEFIARFLGMRAAFRITALSALAAIYLSCIAVFTVMIGPWFAAIVSTGFGYLLGLLFPPIAGTVVASLMIYRMCVVGVKYTSTLMKIAIKAGPV